MTKKHKKGPSFLLSLALSALVLVSVACSCSPVSSSNTSQSTASVGRPRTSPPTAPTAASSTASSSAGADSTAGDYLGCHQFCLQAGPMGGGGGIPVPFAESDPHLAIANTDLRILEGMLPVTVVCMEKVPCQGSIRAFTTLHAHASGSDDASFLYFDLGRSDLVVPAQSTRMIAVKVPNDTLNSVNRAGGRVMAAGIMIMNSDIDGCSSGTSWCQVAREVTVSIGVQTPVLVVTPMILRFPDTMLGETATLKVSVSNVTAEWQTPHVAYDDVGFYPTVFGGHEECGGQTLAPGDACTLFFEFHPLEPNGMYNSMTVHIDDVAYEIQMTGTGINPDRVTTSS